MIDSETVYEALYKKKRPVDAQTLIKVLPEDASVRDVETTLAILETQGRVTRSSKGRYMTAERAGLILCRVSASQDAPSFARPLNGGEDLYLDMPDEIALNGDTVLVRKSSAPYERPRGELARVITRANTTLTGTLLLENEKIPHKKGRSRKAERRGAGRPENALMAVLHDRRLPARIRVEGSSLGARNGDLCLFEVVIWPSKTRKMTVRVKEALGAPSDMRIQMRALMHLNGIEETFEEDALAQANAYPTAPTDADKADRLDLRNDLIFTIDGDDAQDFDDAVSLKTEGGVTRLGVHIADVSHYVTAGSPLDKAAVSRGTSVYLPGLTVPMLPDTLSNGLCSLKPDTDRLTLSALFTINGTKVERFELRETVIRSRARLTYGQVNRLFAGEETNVPEALHATLFDMNRLAKALSDKRHARGALNLDMPEPEFSLNEDFSPVSVTRRERGDAHRLIEEFMLLANEYVAAQALHTDLPFPYRVHEAPDAEKLKALENLLAELSHPRKLGTAPSPKRLQEALDDFQDAGQKMVVARVLLRAMSRARYAPQPIGHYGLATRDYCHFTSPIRRYPDLLAHRMLKLALHGKMTPDAQTRWQSKMEELTAQASACEYAASLCERDADMVLCAAYLAGHIGERFEGTVTNLNRHGIFVTLDNTAEGRVPSQLMDDFYALDESRTFLCGRHTRKIIRLGDRMTVEVYSANILSGEVELAQG